MMKFYDKNKIICKFVLKNERFLFWYDFINYKFKDKYEIKVVKITDRNFYLKH